MKNKSALSILLALILGVGTAMADDLAKFQDDSRKVVKEMSSQLGSALQNEMAVFSNTTGCKNIGPNELNEKIRSGQDFLLLDVRTHQENAAQAIDGSYLLPLQELGHRLHELPKDKEIVVYCRVGNRSAYAC